MHSFSPWPPESSMGGGWGLPKDSIGQYLPTPTRTEAVCYWLGTKAGRKVCPRHPTPRHTAALISCPESRDSPFAPTSSALFPPRSHTLGHNCAVSPSSPSCSFWEVLLRVPFQDKGAPVKESVSSPLPISSLARVGLKIAPQEKGSEFHQASTPGLHLQQTDVCAREEAVFPGASVETSQSNSHKRTLGTGSSASGWWL